SASPATGLVDTQENAFLSDFFECVGLLPLTTPRNLKTACTLARWHKACLLGDMSTYITPAWQGVEDSWYRVALFVHDEMCTATLFRWGHISVCCMSLTAFQQDIFKRACENSATRRQSSEDGSCEENRGCDIPRRNA
ncbi:unnamed protein product, partial [Ectocarpus sp. 12 AP-2014]